jgi:hypothetical protein
LWRQITPPGAPKQGQGAGEDPKSESPEKAFKQKETEATKIDLKCLSSFPSFASVECFLFNDLETGRPLNRIFLDSPGFVGWVSPPIPFHLKEAR